MKKLLHNRNFYLVLILVLVAVAVLIAGRMINANSKPAALPTISPTETPVVTTAPEATAEPTATEAPSATENAALSAEEMFPAPGYVYIVAGNEGRWFALPEEEPGTITVKDEDKVNIIRLTNHSVMMESSTCDNQDCVDQGEVSLENLSSRVLYNMILCLPHSVSIELYSQQEMIAMFSAQMATQE